MDENEVKRPTPCQQDQDVNVHVLLVEDNPLNRTLSTTLLSTIGITPDIAHDGREAVAMTEKKAYDLILMDVQMPVMGGLEATKIIREQEQATKSPRAPIIATTASTSEDEINRCLNAGMDDHLAKPLTVAQFTEKVSFWISRGKQPHKSDRSQVVNAKTAPERATVAAGQGATADTVLDLSILKTLEEMLAMAPGSYQRVLGKFLETTPRLLGEIERFLSTHDLPNVRLAAHTLKSNSAAIGAHNLSLLTKEIEQLARNNESGGIAELFAEAQLAATAVCALIKEQSSKTD